jgi:septum formation protein
MIQSSVTPQLVLASASPRRCELLDQIGVRYIQTVVGIDESFQSGESPEKYVVRLALAKAHAVRKRDNNQLPVLGADTTVVIDNEPLGKPKDKLHAQTMLRRLSGVSHQVMTAVALVSNQEAVLTSVTLVRFRTLTDNEISQYWETGEPGDKAGGYAIQGMGAVFVEHIEGSYSGVMGLPLFETARLLEKFGII